MSYPYDSEDEMEKYFDYWDKPIYRHGFLYSERIHKNKRIGALLAGASIRFYLKHRLWKNTVLPRKPLNRKNQ